VTLNRVTLATLGTFLYRHRSWTAIPVIALALTLLARHPPAPAESTAITLFCHTSAALLVLSGVLLRIWTIVQVPPGACGRGRRLHATLLVTWGPYRWTRNPLYFANFLIVLGLLCQTRSIPVGALVIPFFVLQYHAVIRAEESFLRNTFGATFETWAAQVPRFWPRPPSRTATSPGTFRPKGSTSLDPLFIHRMGNALMRDADTWFASLGGLLLLRWWSGAPAGIDQILNAGHAVSSEAAPAVIPLHTWWEPRAFGFLLGAYLAVRMWKWAYRWKRGNR